MSLRFWSSSKALPVGIQIEDLAWFENSVQGGVVILGIFRDAIAMSPCWYVKQIAEKTLSIIRAVAIAAFGDTGTLRSDLQKLGEATAAVTATILQSYLESENRDGWPCTRLQDILNDLLKTLDTIEVWISSGQAKSSFGRRKCVKMVKQFQERLSEVLERFELASLLRTYTVLPFIKKMIEDYALSLDAGAARQNVDDPSKASVEKDNLILDKHKSRVEKETHDALRLKVRLILRIIEKEERKQRSSLDESAPGNQIARDHNQNPQESEKERNVSQRDELQHSQPSETLTPEAGKMSSDHDDMEQDAVEMLYDLLMDRLSNAAILGPNRLPATVEQPKLSSSPLPQSYSSVNNSHARHAHQEPNHLSANNSGEPALKTPASLNPSTPTSQLNLNKPLPPLELVDTFSSQRHIPQSRVLGRAHELNRPFIHMNKGIQSRGCASLPPGAMPPIISTVSLLNLLTNGNGRADSGPLPPDSIRPERSLSITPLPDGEEEVERSITPLTFNSPPPDGEKKLVASPLSLRIKETIQFSKPSLSTDVDQGHKPINFIHRVLTISKPKPDGDIGKEKGLIQSFNASPVSQPVLPVSVGPVSIKKTRGSPPLPPGAMPPKLSSWSPPPYLGKIEEEPGHLPDSPDSPVNPIPLSSINAHTNISPVVQSNSSLSCHPELTLNDSALRPPVNEEDSTNYHLPPITITTPITLAPLMVVEAGSSHIPLRLPPPPPPPPPEKTPKHIVGPGYEQLRKMSPQMQRYVERLADRIWGGSEGGRVLYS